MVSSPAQLIKEKLDIVEFLRGYLTLVPAGKNFKALCPFHREKSPSFMISPDRQSWRCFGCAKGGDAFAFLMEYEHIDFGEALRVLAEKVGVELRRMNPEEYKYFGLLYDINDAARTYFREALQGASLVQTYLAERKLSPETIALFGIGWAPEDDTAFLRAMTAKGFTPEDLTRAGLLIETSRGTRMARFRGRILFPIVNHLGKVAGFTGRILPSLDRGDTAKYVNSPETPVFQKSKILYGFSVTKSAIREQNTALIVEGQMDMLMSYQAGVHHVVASSGTAFTADHMAALRRVADTLIFCFDRDSAGAEAEERAIGLAEAYDFRVQIVTLPSDVKDPADVVVKDPALLPRLVADARPSALFYFSKYLGEGIPNVSSSTGLRNVRAVLQKLAHMPSAVERDYWLSELQKRTGISRTALDRELEQLPRVRGEREQSSASAPSAERRSRIEMVAEDLLAQAYALGRLEALASLASFLPPGYADVYTLLHQGATRAEDPGIDELLQSVILRSGIERPESFETLLRFMQSEYIKVRRRELVAQIRDAELRKDDAALQEALRALQSLSPE
jgi:DNA primase